MDLKFNINLVIDIDYGDFDIFVSEYYQKDFEVSADLESANDSTHSFNISKAPLNKYEIEEIEKFKEKGEYRYITSILLQDLVNNDKIPEGKIQINISW